MASPLAAHTAPVQGSRYAPGCWRGLCARPRSSVGRNSTKQPLLFGGATGSDYLGDTWTWNGTDWLPQTPAHTPSARADPGIAFDATARSVVIFGGYNLDGEQSDTWFWR